MSSITSSFSALLSSTLALIVSVNVYANGIDTGPLSRAIEDSISLGQQAQYLQTLMLENSNKEQQQLAQLYLTEFEIRKQQRALAHMQAQEIAEQQSLAKMAQIEQALSLQLEVWYAELENRIRQDLPFDVEIRQNRLALLREALDNPKLSLSSKFRQFSEALQIEIKQGKDRQVANEIIEVSATPLSVTTLRIGRLGWYAITEDERHGYLYNKQAKQWTRLPAENLPAVISAIAITRQQALPQWLTLPVSIEHVGTQRGLQ